MTMRSVAVSHGTRIVVSGSFDETIKIWNVLDGILLVTLKGQSESVLKGVLSVALSPDARTIISGNFDGNVKL